MPPLGSRYGSTLKNILCLRKGGLPAGTPSANFAARGPAHAGLRSLAKSIRLRGDPLVAALDKHKIFFYDSMVARGRYG